ncbi:MAG: hypothetical protein QME79_14765 [Bacillota bacterium]|nr:hypothetical protein [Bacillota bacterium]
MAVGDVKSGLQSVNASAYLNIQPPGTEEWVVHNLYWGGQVELYVSDGINDLKFDSDSSAGGRLAMVFHVRNGQYLRVKNMGASAILIGYDGIQTKA